MNGGSLMINNNGNCYLCGEELSYLKMKNHMLKHHCNEGKEKCSLLKIQGDEFPEYWLLLDMPMSKPLQVLDAFLRKIWLECCHHMSGFYESKYLEIDPSEPMSNFLVGSTIGYEYDFGSTTYLTITVVKETLREKQKEPIRLLARNVPPVSTCTTCGAPAVYFCQGCEYSIDNPMYCESCAKEHEKKEQHEEHSISLMLPVLNSPRMGVCGYCGERDIFAFSAEAIGAQPK
jgi:hypothetical protein